MKARTLIVLMTLAAAPSLAPADTCQEAREDAVVYYNPRPFYYWGFIAGMWGGVMISMPLIMSQDTSSDEIGLGYMVASEGACISGIPLFVALLKNPAPPYDVLADIPKEQRTEYSKCYSARANSAQNKAAFVGGLFGTLTGAILFGGALYLVMSATE